MSWPAHGRTRNLPHDAVQSASRPHTSAGLNGTPKRGLNFAALAWGSTDGPLALALHGYPDTAWTWRHLGPQLAERGWRVVAPYTRGYGPTDLAPDGDYWLGQLAADAAALRDELGGDARSVLIGHDWGAATAYALGAHSPALFSRIVTLAVPPPGALAPSVRDLRLALGQLRRSWYMFFQLLPSISERALDWVIPKLWADWSPGYDAREDVANVLASLEGAGRRTAALRYYRAFAQHPVRPRRRTPSPDARTARPLLLYLYGDQDGCLQPLLSARANRVLQPPSRTERVSGTGHFLHLEQPDIVNPLIAEFLSQPHSGGSASSNRTSSH